MYKNVVLFIGINGVGKSTITKKITEILSDSVALSGSQILMNIFGGVSRETLEKLSPTEKMSMMEPIFVEEFEKHSFSKIVIFDTHLVVPIRKNETLVLENIWSKKYAPYIKCVYFIYASVDEIRERRLIDEKLSGRKRDLDINNIDRDQKLNLAVFEEIIAPNFKAKIIQNPNDQIDLVVKNIIEDIFNN